jgi:hypothetical protein
MARIWELRRKGRALGELHEGPGPFISSAQFSGPNPRLPSCGYASRDGASEAEIAALIAGTLEAALASLVEAGFELVELEAGEGALPFDSPRSPLGDFRG